MLVIKCVRMCMVQRKSLLQRELRLQLQPVGSQLHWKLELLHSSLLPYCLVVKSLGTEE